MSDDKNKQEREAFRKKPVVIKAEQFTQEKLEAYFFDGGQLPEGLCVTSSHIHKGDRKIWSFRAGVKTLEGFMTAEVGDWIITGVKGEHYPCKPDIFAATYEPALSQPQALGTLSDEVSDELKLIVSVLTGYPKSMARNDALRAVDSIRAILAAKDQS